MLNNPKNLSQKHWLELRTCFPGSKLFSFTLHNLHVTYIPNQNVSISAVVKSEGNKNPCTPVCKLFVELQSLYTFLYKTELSIGRYRLRVVQKDDLTSCRGRFNSSFYSSFRFLIKLIFVICYKYKSRYHIYSVMWHARCQSKVGVSKCFEGYIFNCITLCKPGHWGENEEKYTGKLIKSSPEMIKTKCLVTYYLK